MSTLFRGKKDALGFDWDAAKAQLAAKDARLARVIARARPARLEVEGRARTIDALAEAIVYQQLSGKAAATIFGRFRAVHGGKRIDPARVLELTDEQLRGAGISRPKIAALRDLARKTLEGVVPPLRVLRGLEDDEIVERLTRVRGIGRWTVEMLLIFRLGRPDVLPVDDWGIRKGYALAYGLAEPPKPRALAALGEGWRPFRTVASWYLWRAIEGPSSLDPPGVGE